MTMKRRQFIRSLGGVGILTAIGGTASFAMPFTTSGSRVVVIGGGFGGTVCAKYIRSFSPTTSVTLIEPKKQFFTCPGSNSVIGGLHDMDYITHSYEALSVQHGITVMHDTVTSIDGVAKTLTLKNGAPQSYDYLVVSPGIDFSPNVIEGYDPDDVATPHAWKAGEQTTLLRNQIQAMDDGGTVLIAPPARPFRAPPAPYERASLIANYLLENKPKSKIVIVDGNDDFAKQGLFTKGWEKLYPDMIEWVAYKDHGGITGVDASAREIITASGNHFKGQVLNIIPPQMAGEIAISSGLADTTMWCPVQQDSFESTHHDNIYVIGDSCQAGDMIKTGHAANTQGKYCAAAIVAHITGKPKPDVIFNMTIYSLVGPKYGISLTDVYRLIDNRISKISHRSSDPSAKKKTRRKEAQYAAGWYKSITNDMFN